ncbi:bifunctional DNA primase/polymerase [Pseudonocardia spinosispora]|uniref:bifunctional DNA primase/polymerase n=1 Tax=Pseudonocardia spinosispora TaxID=103441 RepID=UPI0003F6A030|nr:bifunctional DNA primase/polymerase [Pseudonocardia spinosispora]
MTPTSHITRVTDPTGTATGEQLLEHALAAAGRGWHVFPLRPGSKQPALHGYDRCPRTGACEQRHLGWEQRATTDPDRIRSAWSGRHPFNIGIATGPSGLVVIDLDTAKPGDTVPAPWNEPGVHDGQDVLAVVAEQAGQPYPADTFTTITPSGGLHLYWTAPDGVALRNTGGDRGRGLGWKIDTRAHGGYVVAPGSVTETGTYQVLADRDPAQLPDWLVEHLTPQPPPPAPTAPIRTTKGRRDAYLDAAIHGESKKVISAPTDQRNATLYAAALALGQLVAGGGLTEAEVTAALVSAAARHIALGAYSDREARRTIASGIRAGANRPRQVAA